MCGKCDEINSTITRYRRLKGQVSDKRLTEALDHQLATLEADKLALHAVTATPQ